LWLAGSKAAETSRILRRLTASLRRAARTRLPVSRPRHPRHRLRCLHRKKINISTVLAGQKLGIKEVDDGIRLVTFSH
jgi:hypothetical protein